MIVEKGIFIKVETFSLINNDKLLHSTHNFELNEVDK